MSARHFVWDVSALTALLSGACVHTGNPDWQLSPEASDLVFDDLAHSWDEAIPLGNATLGSLVWEQDSMVRMSLDRVDLWNLRPTGVWSITSSLVPEQASDQVAAARRRGLSRDYAEHLNW